MGESYLVALLKGASTYQFALVFYKHFAATRFFRQTRERVGGR